ncbi:MAG: hypothetical protein BGO63_03980 [Candidatus Accumulibacter sp. 66-26]|nr:MAG: hypothetical protein BGO63_03980 [Candidatus Accumulibacter sp. 66-26]
MLVKHFAPQTGLRLFVIERGAVPLNEALALYCCRVGQNCRTLFGTGSLGEAWNEGESGLNLLLNSTKSPTVAASRHVSQQFFSITRRQLIHDSIPFNL